MPAGCNCGSNSQLAQALGCNCVRRGTTVIASQLAATSVVVKVPLFRIVGTLSGAISSDITFTFLPFPLSWDGMGN